MAVGNGEATSGSWDGSDSILELDPSARVVSSFAPAQWAAENAQDLDLGSMGPLLLPDGLVVASGKGGDVYVLRQGDLGGIGHPLAHWHGCAAFGGAAVDVRAPRGAVAYLPCSDGVAALRVRPGTGTVSRLWQADAAVAGSPVVVGDAVLAVDRPAAGWSHSTRRQGDGARAVEVGEVSRFATALVDRGVAVLGTMAGIAEVSLQ